MRAFRVGCSVKIEDIGPLATCLEVSGSRIRLVLDGEEFWISKRLCKVA